MSVYGLCVCECGVCLWCLVYICECVCGICGVWYAAYICGACVWCEVKGQTQGPGGLELKAGPVPYCFVTLGKYLDLIGSQFLYLRIRNIIIVLTS